MKSLRSLFKGARRQQGLALIIVLSMLALATIVILAFMSVADTENKASNIYSASQSSRRFADTAVNVVISQIRSGSERDNDSTPVIHATQPGAVRKYNAAGDFIAGYKLFSDQNMIFSANAGNSNLQEEQFVRQSEPPANWDRGNNLARYVDMNEPVVKGAAANASGDNYNSVVYFPIIDPRAGQNINPVVGDTDVPVEGFSYENVTALSGNNLAQNTTRTVPAVLKPSDGTTGEGANGIDQLRLAMPVQWLYMLKDGAIGFLDEDGLNFSLLGSLTGPSVTDGDAYGVPSETNPIVSRIAFWTDDETSKININTAAEPTYAGQPIYYHKRDQFWADFPPAAAEYQRYPGHPASVALSTVFFPNPLQSPRRSLDTYPTAGNPASGDDLRRAINVKERIYSLAPRIHTEGSRAGTRTFENDDYTTEFRDGSNAKAVAISEALGERLYASVDELLFAQGSQGGRRTLNIAQVEGTNISLFNKTTLERSSAFLTAHSRASETNLFGLPRVAMWPLPVSKRTGFDNLIEFASRLGNATSGNRYIFQREHSRSQSGINAATHDISISRNTQLLDMLDKILSQPFPTATYGGAGTAARSFKQKLGETNARQVLVSMFDYIRCINLYDSFKVPDRNEWPRRSVDWTQFYILRDAGTNFDTYTPGPVVSNLADRFSDRMLPAHGQVTPSEVPGGRLGWKSPTGAPLRGFGRFITISEIGLQFICTADGQPDMYSWRLPRPDPTPIPPGTTGDALKERLRRYIIPEIDPASFDASAVGAIPVISGGRTALRVDETVNDGSRRISHSYPSGFNRGNAANAYLSNSEAMHWQYTPGNNVAESMIKDRFYSNFPPLRNPNAAGYYGTTAAPGQIGGPNYSRFYQFHPGYDPANWNWTLDYDTPLQVNQKRLQALLNLEFFCPAVGYTELFPDYTIVISGQSLSNILVNGNAVFSTTTSVGLKSQKPMWEIDSHPEVGGFAAFRNIALDRPVGARGSLPEDSGYETGASGQVHRGLVNMELTSSYFNVNRGDALDFSSIGPLTIMIFDRHVDPGTAREEDAVQLIRFTLPQGQAPTPDLVTYGTALVDYTRTDSTRYTHPVVQAPHWWGFNKDGVVGRQLNANIGMTVPTQRGRFYLAPVVNTSGTRAIDPRSNSQSVPGARSLVWGRDGANFYDVRVQPRDLLITNPIVRIGYGPKSGPYSVTGVDLERGPQDWDTPFHFGTDTIRTLQPAHGDARLIAAKKVVEPGEWTPHRFWNDPNEFMAHNFSAYTAGSEPGYDRGVSGTSTQVNLNARGLPPSVTANPDRWPDIPSGKSTYSSLPLSASEYMQRYYDFDDSDPGGRVGPFINKVDEGNYAVGKFVVSGWSNQPTWRTTYFRTSQTSTRFANGSGSFFTPNRMVPSPVIMGSLPSRLWDASSDGAWTNLLFRPYVQHQAGVTQGYAGSPSTHPGEATPPDHYLLDLFWMPIVEPYALSESFSTAGKVNLNYQMLPFTHIRRATAVHAAMKGEVMSAIPNAEYQNSKEVLRQWGANGSSVPAFRAESDNFYWHRGIVVDRFGPDSSLWWRQQVNERVQGTLLQFEERFNFVKAGGLGDAKGGLFRTTSQLCELHLIPGRGRTQDLNTSELSSYSSRKDAMARFWSQHCATGDNTRERPYAYLYNKFTTRSNTFRVHVRAQSIRKASRSVAHNTFDPTKDQIGGEYRGSFLIERYLDQADMQRAGADVDYAAAGNPFTLKPLESYYRFRVIESKRFAP